MKKFIIISSLLVVFNSCHAMQNYLAANVDQQQQPDWRNDALTTTSGEIRTLQNNQCVTAQVDVGPDQTPGRQMKREFWTEPLTMLIHSYNATVHKQVHFSARIHDNTLSNAMVNSIDPGQHAQEKFCDMTFMRYCSLAVHPDDGTMALKPQYVFFDRYAGANVHSYVSVKCSVYSLGNQEPVKITFPRMPVSFHPGEGNIMYISGNTHHLGFRNDSSTRVVLHRTYYEYDGGFFRVGMIVLVGNDDAGNKLYESLTKHATFASSLNTLIDLFPRLASDLKISATAEPSKEQKIDALKKAIQKLCTSDSGKARNEAQDQAWSAFHLTFPGKECDSNEANDFKKAINDRCMDRISHYTAQQNQNVNSVHINKSSDSAASSQSAPQSVSKQLLPPQQENIDKLNKVIVELADIHNSISADGQRTPDERKKFKIDTRDTKTKEAWEAFHTAFDNKNVTQEEIMNFARKIYTRSVDDDNNTFGTALLDAHKHAERIKVVSDLIKKIDVVHNDEEKGKLVDLIKAIKSIYDVAEDRSSAKFLEAASLARIAYRNAFNTEAKIDEDTNAVRQLVKDIISDCGEDSFARAHKRFIKYIGNVQTTTKERQ